MQIRGPYELRGRRGRGGEQVYRPGQAATLAAGADALQQSAGAFVHLPIADHIVLAGKDRQDVPVESPAHSVRVRLLCHLLSSV